MHRVHRRQVTSIPPTPTDAAFTGAATLNTNTAQINTESLVADNSATGGGVLSPTTLSLVSSSSSNTAAGPTNSETSQSANSSSSIPIGTVIGICVGVFAGLSAILLLFFYFSRRRVNNYAPQGTGREAERRKSGRELWVKMEEQDGDGSYEKYAIKRTTMTSTAPSSGTGATAVGRSITVKSAKSAKTFKSLGYGTNLGLSETFKTPDLPPQLEFTDHDIGTGRSFVGATVQPPFTRVENAPISWDGETVAEGQSYLSLKHGSDSIKEVPGPVSPNMVVSHQTPPAVETKIPRWERAEVVSPDGAEHVYGGLIPHTIRSSQETIRKPAEHSQPRIQPQAVSVNPFHDHNPFDDPASAHARSSPQSVGASDSESFFTTKSSLTVRTGAFGAASTAAAHHERMDSNEHAMASLIAALNISQDEARERLSAAITPTPRESAASGYSLGMQSTESKDSEALDEFPLPPTNIEHHGSAN
ncbi:uncharacterized protein FOMMEDRAFT_17615 [Fomitiporia mediterranea MF3/22]|uniref:uncharacterized protein n=1 Tax=Fomitiporia mediterranea (strain MF3/22) TaxID=694068 RepID=UPI0004407CE4|nr:uncharacterized protein FOMMEDRAFT_17615 [Fomitiporia mediterranea MF3/22]EJD07144.1 hypothetical protein FOMMEDRAFT_17615 [Fomitiporia mediterranea MF3/22]